MHATQFHPEKSGAAGLDILRAFLDASEEALAPEPPLAPGNGAGLCCRPAGLQLCGATKESFTSASCGDFYSAGAPE